MPLSINITLFSLAIIIAGSFRSVHQLISEVKVCRSKEESTIETFTMDDAKQFPLYAGGTLVGLYALIKFFGKEIVNPLILTYMGIGGSTGVKGAL
jgi:hypothetical protein